MHVLDRIRPFFLQCLIAGAIAGVSAFPVAAAPEICSGGGCPPESPSLVASGSGPIVDVLDYMLPPHGVASSPATLTFNGKTWRTFPETDANTGAVLPGFYITRGAVDGTNTAWAFEHHVYDEVWVYDLRDAAWSERCLDNNAIAGRLTFRVLGGQVVRGSPLIPRLVASGSEISTGEYYVQGVERRVPSNAHIPGEGRWCPTPSAGWTSSRVRMDWLSSVDIGGVTFLDVIRLHFVGGYRLGEKLFFARGKGLIKITRDGAVVDRYQSTLPNSDMKIRLPCSPSICF